MSAKGRTVLIADDDHAVRYVLERSLTRVGFVVRCFSDGDLLLASAKKGEGDLVITDIVMPSGSGLELLRRLKACRPQLPVIVITAQSTLRNAVQAFERGAFEYMAKPFDINRVVALVGQALKQPQKPATRRTLAEKEQPGGFIGASRAMQELFRTIGRLANSEMTVLIHGESGTGKELVAREVHAHSPRRNGPITAINMAAIPRDLIESELFGHEKGAFTGAVSRRTGHFERAREGTLFLDEIGDMPMEAQTRLLRVLQNGAFTRVGGTETLRADVRIIAATHQDLPAAITAGRFREDLFYRLNVVPLHVPSLKTRQEDIPLLVDYFLQRAARKMAIPAKRFSTASMERLMAHPWPGNVRELENLVQRLMVLAPHETIQPEHLDLPLQKGVASAPGPAFPQIPPPPPVPVSQVSVPFASHSLEEAVIHLLDRHFTAPGSRNSPGHLYDLVLHRVERVLLSRVLEETRHNQVKAARILGINRNTLRKKIQERRIEPKL